MEHIVYNVSYLLVQRRNPRDGFLETMWITGPYKPKGWKVLKVNKSDEIYE